MQRQLQVSISTRCQALPSCAARLGCLDYCLDNAGIMGERALLQDYPTDGFDQVHVPCKTVFCLQSSNPSS
jgi:hypothetical protein